MSVRLHSYAWCAAIAAALVLGPASLVLAAHGGGGGGGGGGGRGGFGGGFGGGGSFHSSFGGGGGWGGHSYGGYGGSFGARSYGSVGSYGGNWGARSYGTLGSYNGNWGDRSYGGNWGGTPSLGGLGAGTFRGSVGSVGSLDRFGGVGATGALRSNIAPYRPLQGTLAGQDRFGHGHDFDHGFGRRGFYPYGLFGFGGLGWGWGYPWWGGYASVPWWYYGGYGDYGDYGDFADYGYPADAYNAVYPNLIVASGVDSTSTADASAAPADTASSTPAETASSTPIDTASASEYYSQALDAFHAGNYANALRFAGHAAIDNPRDPNVHLLLSLSLFALGNYPGAAAEAHAVAAGGVKVDWTSLIGFYNNDASAYTSQLRALESYITKNPSSMAARFLLGFHYLAEGYKDAAQKELLAVVNTVPQDRISADLLVQAGGHVPENVAQKLKENAAHAQGKAPGPAPAPAPNTTR